MPNQDWFNEAHYRDQKIAQMNTTGYTGRTGAAGQVWDADSYAAELAAWNVTSLQNFEACNSQGYESAITKADINISPNAFFDVPVYLQNVATYANTAANGGVWTDPDQPSFPAGGTWTAEGVLDYMVAKGISAWMHYTLEGMANGINPSNTFDTNAYLAARAQAMQAASGDTSVTVRDALAAIQAEGINAIQDYYDYGVANNITASEVSNPTTVSEPAGWTQWGTAAAPAVTDPYEENVVTQTMTLDRTEYQGADGENTLFDAKYPSNSAGATISENDVIDGGTGHNTLQVALGRNWTGFKQQTNEAGEDIPSVTNVGRLKLDHSGPTETPYTFNAQHMEGLERVDINNAGAGTISMTNLAGTVNEVNLKGLSTGTKATSLAWQDNTVDIGTDDTLTLGLRGVGKAAVTTPTAKVAQFAAIEATGIENLIVNAEADTDNFANIAGFNGLQTLKVTGAGNVNISGVPSTGIKSYDASEASGTVQIAAGAITNSTVVKGGTGLDTITLGGNTNLTAATWTGVENLAVAGGVTSVSVNAQNISGLQQLDVYNATGRDALTNVTATDFTINGNADITSTVVSVKGDIANLAYNSAKTNGGVIESNASNNVDININNNGKNNSGFAGTFKVDDAKGDVTVTVEPNSQNGTTSKWGGTINARNAQTFTADIQGTLDDGAVFNVVQGDPEAGRSVSITAADVASPTTGTTLNAQGAVDVALDVTGAMTLKGDISNAQNVKIDLLNTAAAGTTPDIFSAGGLATLKAIQVLDVDAGGEQVVIGDLGAARDRAGSIDVDVVNASNTFLGTITSSVGCGIDVNVASTAGVNLRNITAGTAVDGNDEGDVVVKVQASGALSGLGASSSTTSAMTTFTGDSITVDLSGVKGAAFADGLTLNAKGAINYTGADGADGGSGQILVSGIGSGTSSFQMNGGNDWLTMSCGKVAANTTINVDLGAGADAFSIGNIDTSAARNGVQTISVDLGADVDADTVGVAGSVTGKLVVELSNFVQGTDVMGSGWLLNGGLLAGGEASVASTLNSFGISGATADNVTLTGTDNTAWQYGGDTYFLSSDNKILLVVEDQLIASL